MAGHRRRHGRGSRDWGRSSERRKSRQQRPLPNRWPSRRGPGFHSFLPGLSGSNHCPHGEPPRLRQARLRRYDPAASHNHPTTIHRQVAPPSLAASDDHGSNLTPQTKRGPNPVIREPPQGQQPRISIRPVSPIPPATAHSSPPPTSPIPAYARPTAQPHPNPKAPKSAERKSRRSPHRPYQSPW